MLINFHLLIIHEIPAYCIMLLYTVNHKKCDVLFLTITLVIVNRFL